ncbi:branched-chain amino acid ABC transporter permease [Clostridium sediminicola]|uniref:branched-chain amino acid ABC transporter permease n=1 Tax=Clostridium sediminicola TaxID=3114879 RepID=UPI0031F1E428
MKGKLKGYLINISLMIALYVIFFVLINTGVVNRYYEGILILIGINIILATSLNLVTGFLGQLALGHAGFMAVGAYASALATINMNLPIPSGLQFVISLIIGGLVAALFGLIIGIPALRLRGDYLGIITLGFGEMIRVIIINLKFTNGARGLKGISMLSNFSNVYWITIITVVVIYTVIHSRHGRSILAIRENEIAADAVGVPTAFYKVFAFVLAAFFAGIAGGLFAHYMSIIDPKKFTFIFSVEILVIVVLGGMGSLTGSVIAAVLLTLLPEALRDFAIYRMLIYSVLLIIMMLFRPSGIFGTKELSIQKLLNRLKGKRSE